MDKFSFAFAACFMSFASIVSWLIDKPLNNSILAGGIAWVAIGLMCQKKPG